jgi:hypothetical protein
LPVIENKIISLRPEFDTWYSGAETYYAVLLSVGERFEEVYDVVNYSFKMTTSIILVI